jgi:hypothetical protein
MNSILQKRKMRLENQTQFEFEKTRVYAQKPRLKLPFKISISVYAACVTYRQIVWLRQGFCIKLKISLKSLLIYYTFLP